MKTKTKVGESKQEFSHCISNFPLPKIHEWKRMRHREDFKRKFVTLKSQSQVKENPQVTQKRKNTEKGGQTRVALLIKFFDICKKNDKRKRVINYKFPLRKLIRNVWTPILSHTPKLENIKREIDKAEKEKQRLNKTGGESSNHSGTTALKVSENLFHSPRIVSRTSIHVCLNPEPLIKLEFEKRRIKQQEMGAEMEIRRNGERKSSRTKSKKATGAMDSYGEERHREMKIKRPKRFRSRRRVLFLQLRFWRLGCSFCSKKN